MSTEISRTTYKNIVRSISNINKALNSGLGDLGKQPGALLRFECLLAKLRNATFYNDVDIVTKSNLTFGVADLPEMGTKGKLSPIDSRTGDSTVGLNPVGFPQSPGGTWLLDGPCSPEGWKIWNYNSWAFYNLFGTQVADADNAYLHKSNTALTETDSARRLEYAHPVRYNGVDFADPVGYHVHLWEHARYITLNNSTGDYLGIGSYKVSIDTRFFKGCRVFRPAESVDLIGTGEHTIEEMPVDFTLMVVPGLYVNQQNAYVGSVTTGTILEQIANFRLYFDTVSGNFVLTFQLTEDHIEVNESTTDWANNTKKPIVVYYGNADYRAYIKAGNTPTAAGATAFIEDDVEAGPKKSFFHSKVNSMFTWNVDSPYDGNNYLIAKNFVNASTYDGSPDFIDPPAKYTISRSLSLVENNSTNNSLNGLVDLSESQYVGAILTAIPQGASTTMLYEVLVGPVVESSYTTSDWSRFPYFPQVPSNHVPLARFILTGANAKYIDNALSSVSGKSWFNFGGLFDWNPTVSPVLQNLNVVWQEQVPFNFIGEPLSDIELTKFILPSLHSFVLSLRSGLYEWVNDYAHFLASKDYLGIDNTFTDELEDYKDSTALGSILYRNAMKNPTVSSLRNTKAGEPLAMQFNSDERESIAQFAGLPPSTELMRFNSNSLELTNQRLPVNSPLEIYLEPTSQSCTKTTNSGGVGIGRDYTLRLTLSYFDESKIVKDWYINSSRYFLSDSEYSRRIQLGQSVAGYYKRGSLAERQSRAAGTLESINEFAKHGYAGVVPDLLRGESRPLYMRQVSPDGDFDRPPTEAEFRQRYEQQGYTQQQIDELVQEYLDDGGVFYVIDSRQHPREFVALTNAAINVTTYTQSSTKYWFDNMNERYGHGSDYGFGDSVDDYREVRADSFTIAPSNLSPGLLETRYVYKDNGAQLDDATLLQNPRSGVKKAISIDTAFLLATSKINHITSIGVPIGIELGYGSAAVGNTQYEGVTLEIYTDTDDTPRTKIGTSDFIPFIDIPLVDFEAVLDKMQFTFSTPVTLDANRNYWAVLRLNAAVKGGRLVIESNTVDDSLVAPSETPSDPIGDSTPLNNIDWMNRLYATRSAVSTEWLIGAGVPLLQIIDADGTTVNKDYVGVYADTPLYTSLQGEEFAIPIKYTAGTNKFKKITLQAKCRFSSLLNSDLDYIRAEIRADNSGKPSDSAITISGDNKAISAALQLNAISPTSTTLEFEFAADNLFTAVNDTLYWVVLKKYNADGSVVDFKGGTILLALRDTSTSKTGYISQYVDSWVPTTNLVQLSFHYQTPYALGAFNRTDINHLPGANSLRSKSGIYKVDGHWSWTCQRLPYTQEISAYPRAVYDGNQYQWVEPNSDVFFVVRKKYQGEIRTVYGVFHRFPAWVSLWKTATEDTVQNMDNNFENGYELNSPAVKYINSNSANAGIGEEFEGYAEIPIAPEVLNFRARFLGTFSPSLSNRNYYYVRVRGRDGFRVTYGGSYILDKWTNTNGAITEHTSSVVLLKNGTFYPLQIDHYQSKSADEEATVDTPIEVKWFSHGWEEEWVVDSNTISRVTQEQEYDNTYELPQEVQDSTSYSYSLKTYLSLITYKTYKWSIVLPQAFTLKINGVVIDAESVAAVGFAKISLEPVAGGDDILMQDSATITEKCALVFTIDPTQELYEIEILGDKDSTDVLNDIIIIDSYTVETGGDTPTEQMTLLAADEYGFIGPDTSYSISNAGPISLGEADAVVYLGVGKKLRDINDANYGAPVSDRLVIRSE